MKRLYCNGKKGFCPNYDGETEPKCWKYSCEFQDGNGSKIIENYTNFDRIKAMSVEELTAFIIEKTTPDICNFCVRPHCFSLNIDSCNDYERIIKEYLESEVQGE